MSKLIHRSFGWGAAATAALLSVSTASAAPYLLTVLPDLPGGADQSLAFGVNDAGQVVGYSSASTGNRAFLWSASTGMQNLGDLPGGSDVSQAAGVNNAGQVVGVSAAGTGLRASSNHS